MNNSVLLAPAPVFFGCNIYGLCKFPYCFKQIYAEVFQDLASCGLAKHGTGRMKSGRVLTCLDGACRKSIDSDGVLSMLVDDLRSSPRSRWNSIDSDGVLTESGRYWSCTAEF